MSGKNLAKQELYVYKEYVNLMLLRFSGLKGYREMFRTCRTLPHVAEFISDQLI